MSSSRRLEDLHPSGWGHAPRSLRESGAGSEVSPITDTQSRRASAELATLLFGAIVTPSQEDFHHPGCGGVYVRSPRARRRRCGGCGAPDPELEILARRPDGTLVAISVSDIPWAVA